MNVFEGFNEKVLPQGWRWINEPTVWSFDESKALQVSAPSQADFFRDPSGASYQIVRSFFAYHPTWRFYNLDEGSCRYEAAL
ncbi:hypothetical protein [Paenibacillus polymyxa]|uniref:hypothetical protein n=1 Tax=Paenibacillus polymyxa TaxID=1406 RepID=UPI0021E3CD4F|nr:hypothetical protein [Paenibacillus polymyxa]